MLHLFHTRGLSFSLFGSVSVVLAYVTFLTLFVINLRLLPSIGTQSELTALSGTGDILLFLPHKVC